MRKTTNHKNKRHVPLRIRRLYFFFPVLALMTFLLELRLVIVQGAQHETFAHLAHRNHVNLLPIPAPRGDIYDRNHHLLAYDAPIFSLVYTRGFAPISQLLVRELASRLGMSASSLTNVLHGVHDAQLQVFIANRISAQALAFVSEHQHQLPGIQVIPDSIRVYPMGDVACHVLGYIHPVPHALAHSYKLAGFPDNSMVGWSGVEKSFDEWLRGVPGKIAVEIDSQGVPIRRFAESQLSRKGQSLVLTIDSQFQQDVQSILTHQVLYLQRHGHQQVSHAMAVAINPQNGEILALASYPTYNPMWMAQGMTESQYKAYFLPAEQNWATQMPIAPGSVMKPLTALFAFHKRALQPDSAEYCDGSYHLPKTDGTSIHCWSHHGNLTLPMALAESCDVYFYKLSMRYGKWPPTSPGQIAHWLTVDRLRTLNELKSYQREFGLGASTIRDLPDAESGFVNVQSGQVTDLPYTAIGQNEVFTTMELANYAATLANRGVRIVPHLVKNKGDVAVPVHHYRGMATRLPPADWQAVMSGLHLACNDFRGTAYRTFHSGGVVRYDPAGKTGTAETGIDGFDNAVFIGFAPFDHPNIAIAVVVPGGGHGADSTGPIARAMFDRFFELSAGKHNSRVE
jgi:penicillin-binding protein 2